MQQHPRKMKMYVFAQSILLGLYHIHFINRTDKTHHILSLIGLPLTYLKIPLKSKQIILTLLTLLLMFTKKYYVFYPLYGATLILTTTYTTLLSLSLSKLNITLLSNICYLYYIIGYIFNINLVYIVPITVIISLTSNLFVYYPIIDENVCLLPDNMLKIHESISLKLGIKDSICFADEFSKMHTFCKKGMKDTHCMWYKCVNLVVPVTESSVANVVKVFCLSTAVFPLKRRFDWVCKVLVIFGCLVRFDIVVAVFGFFSDFGMCGFYCRKYRVLACAINIVSASLFVALIKSLNI
ncbi:hypothetical protein EDEG_01492 [Edhazardia aedis USNM 41457]|uniref:Uncharacterized protein n=1 Tax=Edhazardia aedis (strain USNM 41457) TaxID=1003232 RepID=J8ZX18_EDHAE|nr:hypothetical protein EDEG_01492 [Edhazardia aedis USNM 41457]|eukprot:EJW04223.1 hypothetical protein EDEG_01492 [Edhazardia aedis USNM 41457]